MDDNTIVHEFKIFAILCYNGPNCSKSVLELQERLPEALKVIAKYQSQVIREEFTRGFRFLIKESPLPQTLSLELFEGCLDTILRNVTLVTRLPENDKPLRHSITRNTELSLKVLNRLFDHYILSGGENGEHQNHFEREFAPVAISRISDLTYINIKLIRLDIAFRMLPEIVKLLVKAESSNLSKHFLLGGYKHLRIGLIPLLVKYRNYCVKGIGPNAEQQLRRARLETFKKAKRLVFNIWSNLEIYEQDSVMTKYDDIGEIDQMECLSLIIASKAAHIERFRPLFEQNLRPRDIELIACCRAIGSLSISFYGNLNPVHYNVVIEPVFARRNEPLYHHYTYRLNSTYISSSDRLKFVETSLCLLNILNEQPLKSDGQEREYLVPTDASQMLEFASIQGLAVLKKLIRYCPQTLEQRNMLQKIVKFTRSEFQRIHTGDLEGHVDWEDAAFWYKVELVRTTRDAVGLSQNIELSGAKEMVSNIFINSSSQILLEEALSLMPFINDPDVRKLIWDRFDVIFSDSGRLVKSVTMLKNLCNFIIVDPESLSTNDNCVSVVYSTFRRIIQSKNSPQEAYVCAARLMEVLILEGGNKAVNSNWVVSFIELAIYKLRRGSLTIRVKRQLLMVLVAALHINNKLLADAFRDYEKENKLKPQVLLNSFIKSWFANIDYHSLHFVRLSFVGVCALMLLPADRRSKVSSLIAANAMPLIYRLHASSTSLETSRQDSSNLKQFNSQFDLETNSLSNLSEFLNTIRLIRQTDMSWSKALHAQAPYTLPRWTRVRPRRRQRRAWRR